MADEVDPAAEFLAREQNVLAEIDDGFEIPAKEINGVNGDSSTASESRKSPTNSVTSGSSLQPEPEKIRIWREEQQKMLEIKDANEAKKKEELKEQAKKELQDWYQRYYQQLEKSKQINRETSKNAEKEFIADRDSEGDKQENWERISKLCDFSAKNTRNVKDTTRLRSIILQLKQSNLNNGTN